MNSKLFNISPNQVKSVFIISKELEDKFMSFLFDLGHSWIERSLDTMANKLELCGILILRKDDSRLERLFKALYDLPVIYYVIGAQHMLNANTVDPFIHNIFINKDQWNMFNHTYKNFYGQSFEDLLKEIK